MKRLTALLLVCLMAFLPLSACSDSTDTDAVSSAVSGGDVSEVPEEIVLPPALTLQGSVHVPPIGNQGGIGCCTSMAITYMQFTIAVSQYMHAIDPDTDWNPSSGNEAYIFSPKFTYNLAGAGTEFAYNVLKDHGSLMKKDTFFETSASGAPSKTNEKGRLSGKTTSWDVNEGQLQKALSYRLLNFEEHENTSMQLTSDANMMTKIKEALYKGNGVVFSCWSSNWRTTDIDRKGTGTLGKKSDIVIYTAIDNTAFTGSSSDASGNHSVCIVGYDDDITCTVSGVTLKGAFQIANSWGDGWGNDGYVWMMYDAFNTKSEYAILNDGEFYSNTKHITATEKGVKLRPLSKADVDQKLTFTKIADGETVSTVTVEEKEYPLYTIAASEGGFLSYDAAGKITLSESGSPFALIPYEDTAAWSGGAGSSDDEDYKGSYLLYAADNEKAAFVAATTSVDTGLGAFDKEDCCFALESYSARADSFSCRASLVSSKTQTGIRTATGYRFSFIYWDKDITIGTPGAMIEVQLSSNKRDSVKLTVGRTDAAGSTITRVPAMFKYNVEGTNHVYDEGVLTFSGKKSSDTTVETAYFTVGLNELAELMDGYGNDNFLWTVDVAGNGVKVAKITMKDGDGNVIFETPIPDNYPTLGKGESFSFLIDLGGELKEYSAEAEGTRRIIHAQSGQYLTREKMFLGFHDEVSDDAAFDVSYEEGVGYSLYAHDDRYLLDISGKEIAEGVEVKFNAPSAKRNTQTFDMLRQDDGSFLIALHADPSFVISGADGKATLKSIENVDESCKWRFESAADEGGIPASVEIKDGKLTLTATTPEKRSGNSFTVTVTGADGKTVHTEDVKASDESYSVTMDAPAAGVYIITTSQKGKPVGVQVLCTVK